MLHRLAAARREDVEDARRRRWQGAVLDRQAGKHAGHGLRRGARVPAGFGVPVEVVFVDDLAVLRDQHAGDFLEIPALDGGLRFRETAGARNLRDRVRAGSERRRGQCHAKQCKLHETSGVVDMRWPVRHGAGAVSMPQGGVSSALQAFRRFP
jgi:hypothetical protein